MNDLACFGWTLSELRRERVGLPAERFFRHTLVAGASGSGKTTVCLNILLSMFEKGWGIALFDPKGEEGIKLASRVPLEMRDRIVYIRARDTPYRLNLLDKSGIFEDEYRLATDFTQVLDVVSRYRNDPMRSRQVRLLMLGIYAVLKACPLMGRKPSLVDLKWLFLSPSYQRRVVERLERIKHTDSRLPEVIFELKSVIFALEKDPRLQRDVSFEALLSRIAVYDDEAMRNLFVTRASNLNLSELLNRQSILIVDGSDMPKEPNALYNATLFTYVWNAMRLRKERQPFLICCDEFHDYFTDAMTHAATMGRSYGVGMMFAHQSAASIAPSALTTIMDSLENTIVMRTGGNYAGLLAKHMGAEIPASAFVKLKNHECWVKVEDDMFSCYTLSLIPEIAPYDPPTRVGSVAPEHEQEEPEGAQFAMQLEPTAETSVVRESPAEYAAAVPEAYRVPELDITTASGRRYSWL